MDSIIARSIKILPIIILLVIIVVLLILIKRKQCREGFEIQTSTETSTENKSVTTTKAESSCNYVASPYTLTTTSPTPVATTTSQLNNGTITEVGAAQLKSNQVSNSYSYVLNYTTPKQLGSGNVKVSKILYYEYIPESPKQIFVVMTGAGRNASEYFANAITNVLPSIPNSIIITPYFDTTSYPSSYGYQYGFMTSSNSSKASVLTDTNDILTKTTFSVITDIVTEVQKTYNLPYILFGHSAGGQMLVRYAAFYYPLMTTNKPSQIIVANAGLQFFVNDPILTFEGMNGSINGASKFSLDYSKLTGILYGANTSTSSITSSLNDVCENSLIKNSSTSGNISVTVPSLLDDIILYANNDNPICSWYVDHNKYFHLQSSSANVLGIASNTSYSGWKVKDVESFVRGFLSSPIVFIGGRADINPCGGGITINNEKEGIVQGPCRLARAVNNYISALVYAYNKNYTFNWKLRTTYNYVGHNYIGIMADAVIKDVYNNTTPNVSVQPESSIQYIHDAA